ncbi:hypothetical protein LTR41_009860 [Exophiala xenobiotica]|nr:hypothetical protein LTR41_009860 [Exophiala xenobiotica]KAK5416886.1 hypothetical protein LTR06_002872 [Exophiala xenobiotica]
MADAAASLIAIATFGVKLTTTLYEFGANAASAREQTDRIARHLRLYSEVLEVLVDRIDDSEPIHSAKALNLVDEVYDQSYDLFDKIRDLIPNKGDRMTFLRKLAWNFKKSRVALVVSEIEYLKSTVTLLVTVLFAGKKIRSSRRKKGSKKDSEKDGEEVKLQCAKVKNAIVEQINASTQKQNMQVKVEEEEQNEPVTEHENRERTLTKPGTGVLQNSMEIVNFRESLGQTEDEGEERALVLSRSFDLIAKLLDQWTTLAEDVTSSSVRQGNGQTGNLGTSENPQHDQTPANLAPKADYQQGEDADSNTSVKPQGGSFREEKHREMLTKAYLNARNRAERAEEELARLKASFQPLEEIPTEELSHSSTKDYLADTSSSESDKNVLICDSDQSDIRESLRNDSKKTEQYRGAERRSETLWYSDELERLRDDEWHSSDDSNQRKWERFKKRKQQDIAVRMKERDGEINKILRPKRVGTSEVQITARNQRDTTGSQPRRTTYVEPRLHDDSDKYQPSPPPRSRGASSPPLMFPVSSHIPRTRADADMQEEYTYPRSTRHAEEQTATVSRARPSPGDRVKVEGSETRHAESPSGRRNTPLRRPSLPSAEEYDPRYQRYTRQPPNHF